MTHDVRLGCSSRRRRTRVVWAGIPRFPRSRGVPRSRGMRPPFTGRSGGGATLTDLVRTGQRSRAILSVAPCRYRGEVAGLVLPVSGSHSGGGGRGSGSWEVRAAETFPAHAASAYAVTASGGGEVCRSPCRYRGRETRGCTLLLFFAGRRAPGRTGAPTLALPDETDETNGFTTEARRHGGGRRGHAMPLLSVLRVSVSPW